MTTILHLTHTDIALDSRILKEINAAQDAGYKVFGIGIRSDGDCIGQRNFNKLPSVISLIIRSKRWLFLPKYLKRFFVYVEFFFSSVIKAVSYKPDIIHCNDTVVLPIALVTKFFTKAKLIYDAHELESEKNGQTKFSGMLIRYLEKLSWCFIDALIVVSPSIKRWYEENIGPKVAAVVLNSPVLSIECANEKNNYLREYFGIPNDELVFIYIGILGSGRGIELISNVFKDQSMRSHVVFMGFGPYYKELEELSRDYKNIHVHEAVNHDRVVSIAKSADVGLALIENVSLSDYYCLPNKLFEYCFAGIPVLASDFPDIRDIVGRYKLGLVTNLDPCHIKYSVVSFENDSYNYNIDIGGLQDLSWSAQARNLLDLYSRVFTARTPQGR